MKLDELPILENPIPRHASSEDQRFGAGVGIFIGTQVVSRVLDSNRPKQFQKIVIQFIETVILYQFPHWSRKEIEKMLQVSDVRQTRVYQEGVEEGIEKGIEKVAMILLKMEKPIKEIVEATGLTPAQIRKLKKKQPSA